MSLGYSLVKLILKLKGEKRSWSKDPIDYMGKRKQNVIIPNKRMLSGQSFSSKNIGNTAITQIYSNQTMSDYLLFYCHGGGFVYGPTAENWKAIAKIAKATNTKAWMIDYPKAPEYTIEKITENIRNAYHEALKEYPASKIIGIGDSVGANLLISLAQNLVLEKLETPKKLVLITPVLDASLTNPEIKEIDTIDPILSYKGVLSAKKMCAGTYSLKDPMISPLYGSFKDFPSTHLFIATHDILMPDQKIGIEKIKQEEGNDIEVVIGEGMPHIWPLLPIMTEGKEALQKIIAIVNGTKNENA